MLKSPNLMVFKVLQQAWQPNRFHRFWCLLEGCENNVDVDKVKEIMMVMGSERKWNGNKN